MQIKKSITEKLKELVITYALNKEEEKSYKDLVKSQGDEIKKLMSESELDEFTSGSVVAKLVITTKESFNEDKLIEVLRPLKIRGLIKKKEYVDMDLLENAIYNGKLNAAELESCKITKKTQTLRLSKIKKEEEE